jgi:hypothetical protein
MWPYFLFPFTVHFISMTCIKRPPVICDPISLFPWKVTTGLTVFSSWRGELDTTLCDKVCQWLVTARWFSPGTQVSFTNKTDRHDIAEILLNLALNTINHKPHHIMSGNFSLTYIYITGITAINHPFNKTNNKLNLDYM